MHNATTAMPASTRAYRDLNRALLLVMLVVAAWIVGTHLLSMALGRPVHTCASRALFAMPCPLCGLTRGVAALASADVQRATAYNPLTAPVALVLLAEFLYRTVGAWPRGARRLAPFRAADARLHTLALAGFLGYAIGFYMHLLLT